MTECDRAFEEWCKEPKGDCWPSEARQAWRAGWAACERAREANGLLTHFQTNAYGATFCGSVILRTRQADRVTCPECLKCLAALAKEKT